MDPMANPRNRSLFDALREFTHDGLQMLAARRSDAPNIQKQKWVPQDDHVLKRRSVAEVQWHSLVDKLKPDLQRLPSYQTSINLLEKDPVIGPKLNTEIRYAAFGARLTAPDLLRRMLIVNVKQGTVFSEKHFRIIYNTLENLFFETSTGVEFLVPVRFFDMERECIELEAGLMIERLNDDELDVVGGSFPDQFSSGHRVWYPRFGVKFRTEFKIMSGDSLRGGAGMDPCYEHAIAKLDQVLVCLRLYKSGDVVRGPISIRNLNPLMGSVMNTAPIQGPYRASGKTYKLDIAESRRIQEFWKAMISKKTRSKEYLAVAARRFSLAADRHIPEDRIIDLMISAEALFLNDAGDPGGRGELTYRLSQRAAYFLTEDRVERQKIQVFFKQAYSMRSKIIHGGHPQPSKQFPDTRSFADHLEGLLREALGKAMKMAAANQSSKTLVEWNELVLT